jgi:hypothetical protein
MRTPVSSGPEGSTTTPVATRGRFAPGEEAADIALAPLAWGEAPQIIVSGDTGAGKSTAMVHIIERYKAKCPGIVVVIDDKKTTTIYDGQEFRDLADLQRRKVNPNDPRRTIILRGDVRQRVHVDREAATAYAWGIAVRGTPVLLVNDEAKHESVIKNRCWRKGVSFIPDGYTKGRSVGLANLSGSQGWDDLPDEPCQQCTTVLQFKTDGASLKKLEENKLLRGVPPGLIPSLHAMDSPPHERGDHVALVRGREWNGKVYKYAKV